MTDVYEKWRLVRIATGEEVKSGDVVTSDGVRLLVRYYDGARVWVSKQNRYFREWGNPVKRRPNRIGLRIELRQ